MDPMRAFAHALALAAMLGAADAVAQVPQPAPDPWAPVRFLAGKWEGKASGNPGEGSVARTYEFVLNNRFLHERSTSTYPPQEKNRKGEVHEHWSFISHDRARKTLVLRQFHVESFVNQFALSAEKSSAAKLVFESEAFENLGSKWRARETYEVLSPDEFVEVFEIAPPEKEFSVYSRNHFRRAKP